jgi:hypothetical protein
MIKLSYSSLKTLQSCEQKLWHYKVNGTAVDADHVESEALGFGKAFHYVLENTNHNSVHDELINKACIEFNIEESDRTLLKKMLVNYVQYHKESGIEVVKCELGLDHPKFTGFIDALGVDKFGGWWIIDLKTSSRFDESILSRLPLDLQLNLYSYFSDTIKNLVSSLDGKKFKGCRYRVVTKTKDAKVYDIEVPLEVMDPKLAWSILEDNHARAEQLCSGEAPKRNYSACMEYFKPCQYFSQCHGHLFSEAKGRVILHTMDSISKKDLL